MAIPTNWAMIQNVMKDILYQYRIVNILAALALLGLVAALYLLWARPVVKGKGKAAQLLEDLIAQIEDYALASESCQIEPQEINAALNQGEGQQSTSSPPNLTDSTFQNKDIHREADDPRRG